jgi:D-glycero-D-manno-heptose 1,7-bisphosphate phosphatase
VSRDAGQPAVFLDRDGVINENVGGDYVRSWEGFRFLPGALKAIERLTRAGYPIVVVSNQQGIGKGLMDSAAVDAIHERMLAAIRATGGDVTAVLYCPHLATDECECRKPKPGLLTRAADELGLDLAQSVFVGDAASDVAAARAAGCRPVLVLTGRGMEARAALDADGGYGPVDVVADLSAAVELILG